MQKFFCDSLFMYLLRQCVRARESGREWGRKREREKRERKKEREKEREICISASVLTYIFTTFPCACDWVRVYQRLLGRVVVVCVWVRVCWTAICLSFVSSSCGNEITVVAVMRNCLPFVTDCEAEIWRIFSRNTKWNNNNHYLARQILQN